MRYHPLARLVTPLLLILTAIGAEAATTVTRTTVANYFLEWNGQYGGPLLDTSGGFPYLNVVPTQSGATVESIVEKQVTGTVQVPLVVVFDPTTMAPNVREWLVGNPTPATLALVRQDGSGQLVDRLVLQDARVGALEVTEMDLTKPVRLQATFFAASAQSQAASGTGPGSPRSSRVQPPLAVQVESGGGGGPDLSGEVLSVQHAGFVWEVSTSVKSNRGSMPIPVLNCNDVEFVLPHAAIGPWHAWYRQALDGNAQERTLSLLLTTYDGAVQPIVTLQHAGIRSIEPFNHPNIGMAVKASVYCEDIDWSFTAF